MNESPGTSSFHRTRWTLVLSAGENSSAARAALCELCEIYYEPVVAFIRRWRHDGNESEARSQAHAFFESILSRDVNAIGTPDPDRGRFRTYLLGSVKFFLAEENRISSTAKRGGDASFESIEAGSEPAVFDETNFDRDWALTLVERVLSGLEDELAATGKARQFSILRPWLDGNASGPQSDAATALGISETAVKVTIHRLREKFRKRIRSEVASTLAESDNLELELRHLMESVM